MPYADDPAQGHPDVRTQLPGVSYFFLGNGHLAAAVQYSPQEGTPLALVLFHPALLGPKRAALSMHPVRGLEDTQLVVEYAMGRFTPCWPYTVEWEEEAMVPTVRARWEAGQVEVEERFFCPDRSRPRLLRLLRLVNRGKVISLNLRTGLGEQEIRAEFRLGSGEERWLAIEYTLTGEPPEATCRWTLPQTPEEEAVNYWRRIHHLRTTVPLLDELFTFACWQLPATIDVSGRMDASIWQYNLEWVRDHCMNVFGLLAAGHHEVARNVLEHSVRDLVQEDGAPYDSSRPRPPELVELDQNGVLLSALHAYVCWTGDWEFVRRWWHKLVAVAEYPFQFRAERAFLLHNAREYWERMPLHGVEDGFELAYQVWMAVGWEAAARLAERLQDGRRASRWGNAAVRIRRALLAHPRYRLVEDGRFIKRRCLSGEVQWELFPQDHPAIPPGVPLRLEERHWLNPDASCVLPIVLGLVEAHSPLAQATLQAVEELWNQRWTDGGYGRYHVSSEPDSPGPWPLASLLITRAYARARDAERVWRVLRWLQSLPQARSGAWFEFYGPRPIPPCPQVGILLWNWSELLQLLVRDLAGVWAEEESLSFSPWLPKGVEALTLECLWRGKRRMLQVRQEEGIAEPVVQTDIGPLPFEHGRARLPEAVTMAEVVLPCFMERSQAGSMP